jgi:rhamnose utilization protein RhaD (predicted bifunctional aldolase and dehydrogenase)/NAD(P)-dependent dehydrogenase (short-subunit alcohol dehydrogenase family)
MSSQINRASSDPNPPRLDELVELSRYFGSNTDFVIAGGGNTSLKSGSTLWVKPSGIALAGIKEADFVSMDRTALDAILSQDLGQDPETREALFKEKILAARLRPDTGRRPSVECVLHHLLPRPFIVHTHSTVANWLTCGIEGEAAARHLFGDDILWIPYVDPGYVLARSVREALSLYSRRTGRDCPGALLMQNHGLIVCGDTPDEVRETTRRLVDGITSVARPPDAADAAAPAGALEGETARRLVNTIGPLLRALLAEGESLRIVRFDDSPEVMNYVAGKAGREIVGGGPLTPDQIVYCNSFPLWFETDPQNSEERICADLRAALKEHAHRTGCAPLVVLFPNLGMFTTGRDFAAADNVRQCYVDAIRVARGAARFGGVRPLAERDRRFIEAWEVEAYRRQVAAGAAKKGRVSGKVALVTGAAQGFGKEISESLAAEGAHIVLADLNVDAARRVADGVCERHGKGRASAFAIDVTRGESLRDALHEMIRRYGGLDLLVSNAGVLRAGSVKSQSLREFDHVTSVNYRGFFVCVQAVAPVMALQRRAKPDCWSDIVQINSKSGLAGSNRNSAYAGSKFGGIGLTQSFALELIEDGIKVNAICPGNFFDGPLWSDPETGLFVQYLRTGKVPGARTVEDVRRAYEAKVPMGRGCTTADVMTALYYLIDQKYETGQALPVTGGQVMLN